MASRIQALAAIAAGAALLVWPAIVNGYPILFSDTGAFLAQSLVPLMIWDKPWVYGPLLHLFHWRITLWLPLVAQGLMMSHLLWLTGRVVWGARPLAHVALTTFAAAVTTAPFTIALLMPDVFTAAVVLALFLLGFGADRLGRWEMLWAGAVATLGIAAHLSHLPVAAAVIAMGILLRRKLRPALRMTAPLAAALLLLLGTNLVGHERLSLSPHGSTFLLARLQADGPAARTIAALCPDRGWYLCDFTAWMPMDSDLFLWERSSPVNRDAAGNDRFLGGALLSAEAREIVRETIAREPAAVARAMVANTLRQAVTAGAGDVIAQPWSDIDNATGSRIREFFPAAEAERYAASRQADRSLPGIVSPLAWVHAPVLAGGVLLAFYAGWRSFRRGDIRSLALVLVVLTAAGANAFAAGALSKPHHRYQARIAWLIPVVAVIALLPAPVPGHGHVPFSRPAYRGGKGQRQRGADSEA
ncbi:hypothetical protein [Elioraea sp.]|uniref:hypothetical protein n=1 Tax=Elioraea sp. TaxID=2185103 RepID=UPI0025C5E221|nr:hypothetical protein [Elioraea sp.]